MPLEDLLETIKTLQGRIRDHGPLLSQNVVYADEDGAIGLGAQRSNLCVWSIQQHKRPPVLVDPQHLAW